MAYQNNSPSQTSTPKSKDSGGKCSSYECNTPIKYTDPTPITPMPKYDDLNTPEICKLAKKYGMKQVLGKARLKRKLKEVYLYNHQLSSPSSEKKSELSSLNSSPTAAESSPIVIVDSPKTSDTSSQSKGFCVMKHFPENADIIDLTDPEDGDDVPLEKSYGADLMKRPPVSHAIINEKLSDDTYTSLGNDRLSSNTVIVTDDQEPLAGSNHCTGSIPTVSLLDSSTESFTDATYSNRPCKVFVSNSATKKCSTAFESECDKSDCSFTNQNLLHSKTSMCSVACDVNHHDDVGDSVSDIFEMSSASEKEACHSINVGHFENASEGYAEDPGDKIFNHDREASSDENSEEIYAEREKFHHSLFGSMQQISTDDESDSECISLFERIMSKRKLPPALNSESDTKQATDNEMGHDFDREKQITELSPKNSKKSCKYSGPVESSKPGVSNTANPSKSMNVQLNKENRELEMCHAIKADTELHTQILLYRPIYFSQFRTVMKNYGIRVPMNELRDFLDSKGITFSTADETQHKGPRGVKRKRKAK